MNILKMFKGYQNKMMTLYKKKSKNNKHKKKYGTKNKNV